MCVAQPDPKLAKGERATHLLNMLAPCPSKQAASNVSASQLSH